MPIGRACASYQMASGSTSTERRFITLLDADTDQLPHRLRQMIALLKEQSIDFDDLLTSFCSGMTTRSVPRTPGRATSTET